MGVLKAKVGGSWVEIPGVGVIDAPPAWIAASGFTNGWTATTSGGFGALRYRKIGDIVYVEGTCGGGTTGTAVFTLPAGYRPPADRYFIVAAGVGSTLVTAIVTTAGSLLVYNGTTNVCCQFQFSVTP